MIPKCLGTLVVVPRHVLLVNVEVMICVQFPKLAVYNIKVFIGKVLCQLVHIFFLFQQRYVLPKQTEYTFVHVSKAKQKDGTKTQVKKKNSPGGSYFS